ncbi:two-component sensor histidine kinase [Moraxella bovis]|uniref:ATP-binding protein n=1 Tax=Moraxella bovis TaxID=476 RepID=UPI002227B0EC|nr:ATP-binding protein [Moraxella bovis]UYZ68137.1 two-component sensor histidine kinase [Moraxella bovis]UYZ70519.1 two-component sensor histidine kinase [Moraxella bovis]UYZ73561.1 two-component sensor histidine kinase [Moraxella bovis]UZA13821.1 two-component sensor histidine kinase [Moraxella bovis]UZA27827.1 two-component sensor histidine kinase [Moraxella bovis]
MALSSITERSIFFRIYAGLLLVCFLVAFFGYFLMQAINQQRLQSYRESIATVVFYLGTASYDRRSVEEKESWLMAIGREFGSEIHVVPMDGLELKGRELKRLKEGKSVVRYDEISHHSMVYHAIDNDGSVLSAELDRINERQIHAVMGFLLDELQYYPSLTDKQARLAHLSQKFGYSMALLPLSTLGLDKEQFDRLNTGKAVLSFDNENQRPHLSVMMASTIPNEVLVVTVPLFNFFSLDVIISIVLTCLLLVSFGVYALIFPLERRLQLLQMGVNKVAEGKLDTMVQVAGYDDIARLSSTFNAMIRHIKRLIESQRELTRAVSHELRTPVARIRFAVDMLADDDDYESRQVQKQYIDDDIASLNELIDEILTYAKLEEGSPKMDWEMVCLKELLEQIERETNALGKPIAIQIKPPAQKVVAMADRRYLHRVVQNLAGNALRYAKSTIIISAGVKKGMAFVTVEDDGHGIPEADREKVFIPFARLDDSRTRASGGYGLGLSIVSRIAFWFSGNMSVDESPSLHGARFTMEWPVKQVGVVIVADELTGAKSEKKLIGTDE